MANHVGYGTGTWIKNGYYDERTITLKAPMQPAKF
jgi:hypothetical protein